MKLHIEADAVVFELLALPSFYYEAGSASHSARGGVVQSVPELQAEEVRIVKSPAGHSTAGKRTYASAPRCCRRPVGHPSSGMAPIHLADTYLAENETTTVHDSEGIRRACSPLVIMSLYPPLCRLVRINGFAGLTPHEGIRARGHHRPDVLGLPSPQHQARGCLHEFSHDRESRAVAIACHVSSTRADDSVVKPDLLKRACQGHQPATTDSAVIFIDIQATRDHQPPPNTIQIRCP